MKKRLRSLMILVVVVSLVLSGNTGVAGAAAADNAALFQMTEEEYDSISLFQIDDYSPSFVTFSWFSDGNNDGFFVYRKSKYDTDFQKVSEVANIPYATHYFRDDNFVPGIKFTYKVTAYRRDEFGNVTEGQSVSESIEVGIPKVNITAADRSGKEVALKWKKAAGVSGYEIFGKTGNGAYKRIAKVSGANTVEYVISSVTTSKKISYKVRAFVSYRDNVVYGAFGSVASVYSTAIQKVVNKFKKLQKKYPSGKYWNHVNKNNYDSDTLTNKPCTHISLDDISTCNYYYCPNGILGYQCYGFAWKMSDLIYGKNAKIKKFKSFDKCKMGDVIRYKGHSVIVTEKHKNYVVVGECNYGNTCMIMWGRRVYKRDLKKATYSRRI